MTSFATERRRKTAIWTSGGRETGMIGSEFH
jgi:hypothetical protein